MSDERLSRALWGAMAIVVALMLEASHRLRDPPAIEGEEIVVSANSAVVELDEPADEPEARRD
ncbi:hypothetical protein OB905_11805 [Halobacteria archaeon AArc-dxtr1]|nr:hypothetical protein [Halobacteria archaeon AArc-dxtr1]